MDNAETNTNEAVTPDAPVSTETGSNETTENPASPVTSDTGTEEVVTSNPSTDSVVTDPAALPNPDEFQYVYPIEWRHHSAFTSGDGLLNVIHEVTLGDLLISTLLMVLIVWQVVSRLVRR